MAEATAVRIYHNPYGDVRWDTDLRLKAQHHDHAGTTAARIQAYDNAGYDVVSLMDYSGNAALSYAQRRRLWPPELLLPYTLLSTLNHIQFFVPNAEEVGLRDVHVTSPFLRTYVEAFGPQFGLTKQDWQYESAKELIQLIRSLGGLPIIAHPWGSAAAYAGLPGVFGVEIYTAYAEAERRMGTAWFVESDRNAEILALWDRALEKNQGLVGIAVNDHFGPFASPGSVDEDVKDSGKIVVLCKTADLDAYRSAFSQGAVLAIKDLGIVKDRYPQVYSIAVGNETISVDTDGQVRWVSGGNVIAEGNSLAYSQLAGAARYVRAEIRNAEGSTVYTQAFGVRPVGDVNGDGEVNDLDEAVCKQVEAGTETAPDSVEACALRPGPPSFR